MAPKAIHQVILHVVFQMSSIKMLAASKVPLTPRATVSPRTPLLRASSTVPVAKDGVADAVEYEFL